MSILNLQQIKDNRSSLMGIAIIMIIFYHYYVMNSLLYITRLGYMGVDIFFLLSSFGLYYSLSRNSSLSIFYTKRFTRIWPTYFIACILAGFLTHKPILDSLYSSTTLGYWLDGPYYEWYIPTQFLYYLLFPLLFRMLMQREKLYIIFLVLYTIFGLLSLCFFRRLPVLTMRFPIFMLGALFAKWATDSKESHKSHIIIIMCICFVLFLILFPLSADKLFGREPFRIIATSFFAPVLVLILCLALRYCGKIKNLLTIIGNASLEIYLFHLLPVEAHWDWLDNLLEPETHNLTIIPLSIIMILFGIILHKLFTPINNTLYNIFVHRILDK